jgi:hypothetical protein
MVFGGRIIIIITITIIIIKWRKTMCAFFLTHGIHPWLFVTHGI